MTAASFLQPSFLGGEWSKQMQGRADNPGYRTAMNICLNGMPVEEGAWMRRPGTRLGGPTRNGAAAVLREFHFEDANPFDAELTQERMRLWQGADLVVVTPPTAILAISTDTPAAVTTAAPHTWNTGDQILIKAVYSVNYDGVATLLGRQFLIAKTSATAFTLVDALTGAPIDGSGLDMTTVAGLNAYKIVEIVTPYREAELQDVRLVQDSDTALLLHHTYAPRALSITLDDSQVYTSSTFGPATFVDGPYLDPPKDGSTLAPSGTSGSITLTASATTSINGGRGFVVTDVGRQVRLFSEPTDWASGTGYSTNDVVKFADTYWTAIASSTGVQPDTDPSKWAIDTTAAIWTWGTITAVTSALAVQATLTAASLQDNVASGDLLYAHAIITWRLGAFCDTVGFPANGTYYEGRVWFGGCIKNRFDACVTNDFANGVLNMAPTGKDGTVADNSAITEVLNSKETQMLLWMDNDEQGVVAGTLGGEWLLSAASAGDIITPTSIKARETSHYGTANIQPIKVGRATVFVQRYARKIYEYLANPWTAKYVADNLSHSAKHLSETGIEEIAFQRELTPIIWARTTDGRLIGCTYKHDDPMRPLDFAGWHRHEHGCGRTFTSIQAGPAPGGKIDTLAAVTFDSTTGFHYVEFLETLFDESDSLLTSWFVDGGVNPPNIATVTYGGKIYTRLYGLWYMEGETVSVWGAGLDLGDILVSGGQVDVEIGAPGSPYTADYLAGIDSVGSLLNYDAGRTYIMEAKENYDPARARLLDAGNPPKYCFADQQDLGISYDHVGRQLFYAAAISVADTLTNDTGFVLWDGENSIDIAASYDATQKRVLYIARKNIDTGDVNFTYAYDPGSLVPADVEGDGTWRRFTTDTSVFGGSLPILIDPRTQNAWLHAQSCFLYYFAKGDNYTQHISPLRGSISEVDAMYPVGLTDTWVYVLEQHSATRVNLLKTTPVVIQADEIAADVLLAYGSFAYDDSFKTGYFRQVLDHAGNLYAFNMQQTGTRDYRLWQFTKPTLANPTTDGGFSDITPWDGSTGPNTNAAPYVDDVAGVGYTNGGLFSGDNKNLAYFLPATGDLVLISKFFAQDTSSSSSPVVTDPTLQFWDCTYVHLDGVTFDYHSAFITGYMSSTWVPTNAAGAAYSVIDCRETNLYLGMSDYLYTDVDYTKPWLQFTVQPVVAGAWTPDTSTNRTVFVQYGFTYGSAPVVLQVIDEQGWDNAYPTYAAAIGLPAVVDASMCADEAVNDVYVRDNGLYDAATNSFWWSGQRANFWQFDTHFSSRNPGGDIQITSPNPPLLRLAFGKPYTGYAVGCTYTSQGQILRAISSQESGAQNGPALGKTRRSHQAAILVNSTQGVSFGTDFDHLNIAPLLSDGGTVPLTLQQLKSGIVWTTVDDEYSFDSMLCWQITRPYPTTIVAAEVFLKTQDR